jgi:YVTN family beta-propeller protein
VTIDVRSPIHPSLLEAVGVTDEVTVAVHGAIRSDIAELVAVTDDVTIDVRSPIRPNVAEAIGVADDVTITVEPATAAGFAYIALQGADSVAVLDRATNTILTTISVGLFPFAVAVRPGGSEVYVTNRGGGSVSVIDVATQSVVATIAGVASDPIDIAFSPDGSTAYVVDNDASLIGVIDAATRTVTHLTGTTRLARAIALTTSGATAYVAAVDSLVVFDLATGMAVDTISGTFSSGDVTVAPGDSELWLTDIAGHEVLVLDPATLTVAATVSGIAAPEGIVIDGTGTRAYVAGGGFNVTPIDVASRTAGASIGLSFEPDALAVSADGSRAYVSAGRQGTQLAVVDLTTGTVLATLAVGSSPAEVGLTP